MTLRDYLYHEEPGITLYRADNREVLPLLPAGIDLVLTSPPYNLGTSTGGGFPKALGHYPAAAALNRRGGAV